MSKGESRTPVMVKRVREAGTGGGSIERDLCPARKVRIKSDRAPHELRALEPAYLAVDDQRRVVIRRGGGVIAVVVSDVAALRRCIKEFGARYEADLPKTTDAMVVPVRPLAQR